MKTTVSRWTATAIALTALVAGPLSAQTTIFSTFGAGDSFISGGGYQIDALQGVASSFVYGGPSGDALWSVRVAMNQVPATLATFNVGFWSGADINTAALLEAWGGITGPDGVFTLNSAGGTSLTSGMTYWVAVTSSGARSAWAWEQNDQGITGSLSGQGSGAGSNWNDAGLNNLPAYDVSTVSPGFPAATVPEPATMTLMAIGLTGMAASRRKKKSKQS